MELVINWPQGIWLTLVAASFGLNAAHHGKDAAPRNVWVSVAVLSIHLGLLYWGGFFTRHCG